MASVLHGSARTTPRIRAELQASKASFSGGVYNWGGDPGPPDQGGLTFDNSGGLLPSNDYSVALKFLFDEVDGVLGVLRILDVNNRQSDDGLYYNANGS
jgi:hypothetical protein